MTEWVTTRNTSGRTASRRRSATPSAMKAFKNFVNGEWVDAKDGRTSPVINPATGEQYAEATLSGPADVDFAMQAAATAFEDWRDSTPSERSLALFRIADAI